jgi:hypothetical protein
LKINLAFVDVAVICPNPLLLPASPLALRVLHLEPVARAERSEWRRCVTAITKSPIWVRLCVPVHNCAKGGEPQCAPRRRLDGPFAGLMETLTMSKRSRKQFTIRLIVAIGVALGGISAIGSVIAYSAVERAWMIAQETATKPFRPPVPKAEFRLSDQQQLRRVFLGQ